MNRWECDFEGCKNSCIGTGGAIGLRAIGWYFVPSMHIGNILCPAHNPEYNEGVVRIFQFRCAMNDSERKLLSK